MASLKQTERYHRNRRKIPKIILSKTGKKEIIFGAKASNKQLPLFLNVRTRDFDIYSSTPKKDALELERALDKDFGGNFFRTEAAEHKGTFKVISNITGNTRADFSKKPKNVPFKVINGKKYVTLDYIKSSIRKTLRDPIAEFRHVKEKDRLKRILLKEKLKRKMKRK